MGFHRKPAVYVNEVNIKVLDLEQSLRYYLDVIGFAILERTDRSAILTADGKTGILTLEQPELAVPKQGRTTGLYHFAILMPQRSDLANFVFHLLQMGVQIASADHLVSEAIYLSDPDGNGIEVYIDRNPSGWSWNNGEVAMTVDPIDFADLLTEGKEGAWQGLPKETIMGHIHLHVADLDEAQTFYVEGLGFDVVSRLGDQALFLSTHQYHHHIGLNTWNGVGAPHPPENSVGLLHFTILYPNESELVQAADALQKINADVEKTADGWITRDPSGNVIRLKAGN